MALVAYDYDSTSEAEEDTESKSCVIVNTNTSNVTLETSEAPSEVTPQEEITASESKLFTNLPQTKTAVKEILEDQIEDFVPKSKPRKEKQKVKITIPSLSQFADVDDDEPLSKKQKASAKGSGLMSLLPPVKGSVTTTKSFVPNVVKNKHLNGKSTTSALVPHAVRKKAEAKKSLLLEKLQQKKRRPSGSDLESDDDIDMPETFDDEMWEKVCGRPKPKPKPKQIILEPEQEPSQEVIDIAPEPVEPYDGLDNKAFKELVGKNKRPLGNIKLIDIHEEEILPEKDIWMTKSLTDPEMAPKPEIDDPVDPTRRKKHHITYLAQQAKANEQELQNAWSASKNSRMATRAKYGF